MKAENKPDIVWPKCRNCGLEMAGANLARRYCSIRCKCAHRKATATKGVKAHDCRECGKTIPIGPGSFNKWICSDECRKARQARSVREFHGRRPQMEAIYRQRTKEKRLPDSNQIRFYKVNPEAPRACQSCGEARVLDTAHKPGHERIGRGRRNGHMKWPEQVWVLCPTCHALLDRMHYSPSDLGLEA